MSGLLPIPWSKIVEYGRYHGMSDWMIDQLIAVIFAMDAVNVEHANKRAAKQSK